MENAIGLFSKNRMLQVAVLLFFILTGWWAFTKPLVMGTMVIYKHIWGAVYVLMSIFGGTCSLLISNKWGGRKSLIGKVFLLLSISLFLQVLGQVLYTYYTLFENNEMPYPSLGDIGYFGSVVVYIYAAFLLARYIGISISIKLFFNRVFVVLIPLGMFALSYYTFLYGYDFTQSDPLKTFLDFGYPMGQAIYVSIALLILFLSQKTFGGLLKKPVLFLVFALVVQYVADSFFLYEAMNGTWYVGGVGDYLYLVAYFVMTFMIVYLNDALEKIKIESSRIPEKSNVERESTEEEILNQILVEVIKRQVKIMGAIAWSEVRKVPDILVHDESNFKVTIAGDPKNTVDKLVRRYKKVFGDLAVAVSKSAVYNLLRALPPDKVPEILK